MRSFSSLLLAGAATATTTGTTTGCTTGDFCVTRCNDENNNNRAAMTISVDKDYMDSNHPDLSSAFTLSGNDYTLILQAGDAGLNLNMADSDYIFLEYELETAQVDVAGATNLYFAGRTTTFKCKYPRAINVGGNYTVTDEPDPSPYEHTGFLQYDFTTTVANGRTTVDIVKQHGIPGLEANVQNCAVTYASMPDDIVYPIRNQPTWGDSDSCIDNRIGTTFTYANGGATIDWRTFHFNVPNASAISQEHNIACNIEVSETLSVSAPSDCSCHDYASCARLRIPDGQCTVDQSDRALDGLSPSDPDVDEHLRYRDYHAMTIEMCVNFCKDRNFLFAGIQVGQECYCGNTYPTTVAPPGECDYTCHGDSTQICGGSWRNTVYHAV